MTDVLDRVARFAPTTASVAAEWTIANDDEVLARITRNAEATDVLPLHFVPAPAARRTQWRRMLPVAASAAVLAVAAGGLVAMLPGGSDEAPGGRLTGPVFTPPPGLSAKPDVGRGQIGYRELVGVRGTMSQRSSGERVWVRPNGDTMRSIGDCRWTRPEVVGFDEPTAAFLAALPTDVGRLSGYLRRHVEGSSSRDEAVFVAAGDMLREADGLASPRLRAALVAVLSRTPGVTLHERDRDALGRPALRLDFVDQRIRPNEVQSLYFDPIAFHLVEERDGSNGEPGRYTGPSPAYTGHGQTGRDPEQLPEPGAATVLKTSAVVKKVPKDCHAR